MVSDTIHLSLQLLLTLPAYLLKSCHISLLALLHRHTYTSLPENELKNVIVIGGSFGGYRVAKRLSQTLPTGYRVVLVERNSHLNYVFAFPRFGVEAAGREEDAFIPYDGLVGGAVEGIFKRVQDEVVGVKEGYVQLGSGERLGYEYLVVATGTSSCIPSKLVSTDSADGAGELRGMQDKIRKAGRIAVVGGGAVGVELAGDIKDFWPEKEVTLVHSRSRLLHGFGERLSGYVAGTLGEMGVELRLGERPRFGVEEGTLGFASGEEEFDLIFPCTGQRPNSDILSALSPSSISKDTAHILINPSLQIADERFPRIFAMGDVAATGGPKMGRAAWAQAEVVTENVRRIIDGKDGLSVYKPNFAFEGSIKLTLGKSRIVLYSRSGDGSGREILVPLKVKHDKDEVRKKWWTFGVDAPKS